MVKVHCPSCYYRFDTEEAEKEASHNKVPGGNHYIQDPKTRMYSLKEKLE